MPLNCGVGGLLWAPWNARKSKQSILKEINPENALEGLMLKLKLQYFGHLMRRADSLEKTYMLGMIEGRRRRGWQDETIWWHHWLSGHEFEQAPVDVEGQGRLTCYGPWSCKEMDRTEWLNNNLIIKSFKSRVFSGWWQKWKWKWERERVRIYITAADSKGRVGHVRRNTSHLQEWRVASSSQLNKKTKTKTNQQKRQLRFTASSNRILLTI